MCLVSADKSRVRGEPCDLKFLGAETVHFGPTQEFGLEVGASDPDAVIEEIIQKRESLEQVAFFITAHAKTTGGNVGTLFYKMRFRSPINLTA